MSDFLKWHIADQLILIISVTFLLHRFYVWGHNNGYRRASIDANKYRVTKIGRAHV